MSDHDIFKSASESSEEEEMKVSDCERLLTAARNGEFDVIRDLTTLLKRGEINLDVNCKGLCTGWVQLPKLDIIAHLGYDSPNKI